ncbi:MAG: RnfABCDGE type electron transport complex subunit D [Oscillospiraceae bacterium]|nr:RnfABCDGE type electron transport complex subunit D [Oscillospiraceae bacterium]
MQALKTAHAPHIRGKNSVQLIMLDVLIALLPATIAGIIFMGYRAALLIFVCIASSVLSEALWQIFSKKSITVSDLSATVTGLLLALALPVTLPLWMAAIGSAFAIIVVKQFFGGLGGNFVNPALAGRAFLMVSWFAQMTRWTEPFTSLNITNNVDVISTATPLELLATPGATLPSYLELFIGNVAGTIGEVSAVALLLGGIYLIARKVINWKIPAAFIGTVVVGTFIFCGSNGLFAAPFGGLNFFGGDWLYHIIAGSLLLGAFFMATDPVTTPISQKGQVYFGIGCGIITVIIRLWGGYAEGVMFAILLMNVATPLIDKISMPKRLEAKGAKS